MLVDTDGILGRYSLANAEIVADALLCLQLIAWKHAEANSCGIEFYERAVPINSELWMSR
jgi:hypothetical protein